MCCIDHAAGIELQRLAQSCDEEWQGDAAMPCHTMPCDDSKDCSADANTRTGQMKLGQPGVGGEACARGGWQVWLRAAGVKMPLLLIKDA